MGLTRKEAEQELEDLRERLLRYQREYYIDNAPSVSDREYDRLFDRLLAIESEFPDLVTPDSPSHRVGSDLSRDFPEVEHSVPVLSLDKVYTGEELRAWMQKTADRLDGSPFVMEEKLDGISLVIYYRDGVLERAVTRGNGRVGNDVTANAKTIQDLPLRLSESTTVAVRGEVYLQKSAFERINRSAETAYANPRNFAGGTLRRAKSNEVARVPLRILVYEGYFDPPLESHMESLAKLHDLGFCVNDRIAGINAGERVNELQNRLEHALFGDLSTVDTYINKETEERPRIDYEIDGLVVKVDDIGGREELGYTGHHPRWAVAYKFESPEGVSDVHAIDVQVGRTGRITPVARITPTQIGGTTVSNVTLHNQDYIVSLELNLGDRVAVSRRGDVIPAVERVLEKRSTGVWQMPATCPSCEQSLEKLGAHHFCVNYDCPARRSGRLYFFAGVNGMDIDYLGSETVDTLLEAGLLSGIPDIYRLDFEAVEELPGFGKKKVELLRNGIEKSKERSFSVVLPSLGITDVGPKVTELMIGAGIRDIDSLLEIADAADVERLVQIDGIGEKTARSIIDRMADPKVRREINDLRELGLNFEAEGEVSEAVGNQFEGQIWCVTGSFERFNPREKAMEEIKKRGGRTVSSVSGKTTHLLAGSSAGSKLDKARSVGARIVDEDEFIRLLENGEA